MTGVVEVNGIRIDKPGHFIHVSSYIVLKKDHLPYVSRGGLKLEAALDCFSIPVNEKILLDIGASTGGFTDCLLQRGAKKVISVDVGHGQFHWKLRQDDRVKLMERTNARYLTSDLIGGQANGAVIDVSFISLRLIVPIVSTLLLDNGFTVALIKPQFEVGRDKVGKGGVVRDPAMHDMVIDELSSFFRKQGWNIRGCIPSPILGPKGNREFLMYITLKHKTASDLLRYG